VPKGTPRQLIVVYKPATHPYRNKVGQKWALAKNGKWKKEWYDDRGGHGTQIEREIPVCVACKKEELNARFRKQVPVLQEEDGGRQGRA
jgi:hypothetical protein